jgi:hypothetical protein
MTRPFVVRDEDGVPVDAVREDFTVEEYDAMHEWDADSVKKYVRHDGALLHVMRYLIARRLFGQQRAGLPHAESNGHYRGRQS